MNLPIKSWISEHLELTHSHNNQRNITSMEGIRGIAILLVFFIHYSVMMNEYVGIAANSFVYDVYLWLRNIGSGGVDLFFVLSGYLIYGTIISKQQKFNNYFKRRLIRIYPAFIFVFLLYVFLSFIFTEKSKIPPGLLESSVFLIQNFLLLPPVFTGFSPMIDVAWSLSYEMTFYILIPIIVSILKLKLWSSSGRIGFFLLLAGAAFYYFLEHSGHFRMVMFLSGILLYELVKNKKHITMPYVGLLSFIGTLILSILLMVYNVPNGAWFRQLVFFTGFFMLCYEALTVNSGSVKLLNWSWLRWYGNMSYSYYLIHGLALNFFFLVVPGLYEDLHITGIFEFSILAVIAFSLTLIPSFFLFIWIEKPLSLAQKKSQKTPVKIALQDN